ncbi:ABC transporter substrate-binding protein [Pseudonocardia sp. H11422]|uniref:ABC transporter substrate-binding protein n=1 Tax=Pseudonocardia sp. H11422 TaxID=2835866 RepID=UPI001BDD693D|nr:ABC transporter substrate-binding protein [Pseudonocardia sp. H11422]
MTKTTWRLASLLALAVLALPGCGGPSAQQGQSGPIKLGGYVDLTGPTANVGEPYAQGLRDRFTLATAEGGVNGNTFELSIEDYGYTLPRAEQAFTRFVESEQVPLTFTWGTADVLAQIPKYAQAKVPTVSGALAENMSQATEAPYTFALGPSYAQQFRIAMDFAKKQGATKVGAIAMDTGSGREPLPFAEAYAKEIGLEWVGAEIVGTKSTDNSVQIRNIDAKGAEFIVVHQQDARMRARRRRR